MGIWIHRLTEKNLQEKTAICSNCGKVKLKKAGRQWKCEVARKEGHYKKYQKRETPPKNCEICGSDKFKIYQDHDHRTGKWRGWLCVRCNTALGLVEDDPKILLLLIEHLKK